MECVRTIEEMQQLARHADIRTMRLITDREPENAVRHIECLTALRGCCE
jgi:hypothetical protein